MNERTERFEIAGTPRLSVRLPAGEVRVLAGPSGQVTVRVRGAESDLGRLVVTGQGDGVTVEAERSGWGRWAAVDVEIAVGAAPEVRARLASCGLVLDTTVREVDVITASGKVQAGVVEGRLVARLASGDLDAAATGSLDVVSASGDVRVPRVLGEAGVKTASGDVALGTVAGDLAVRTASGDIVVSRLEGSRLDAKTVSGDVRVGVPAGRRYTVSLQSLSGDVRTDFPVSGEVGGGPARLQVTTVSGDIRITGAADR
jgi:DUF4097 and DUF4098 domain-containing protein YvlB